LVSAADGWSGGFG